MSIEIQAVTEVTEEVVDAFARLIPQLSASTVPPGQQELTQIVSSPATILLVARDSEQGGQIVGTLTLALFRIPTGLRAWIEDVVVDTGSRRKGIGEALCRAAIARAAEAGARTVDLTSRPSREEANRLYRRLGFAERDTNVYRYTLS